MMLQIDIQTSLWVDVQSTFGIFKMAVVAMETTKKHEKFKVLGIGWNLIEMLYGMCINGFEALKFQNACRWHWNRQNTQFNTKVGNNLVRLRHFKIAAVAMETTKNVKNLKCSELDKISKCLPLPWKPQKTLNLTQRWITTFWGLEISKWPPLPRKLFLNLQHRSFSLKSPTSYSVWQTSFAFEFMLII